MKILVCIKPDMSEEEIGPFECLALEAGLVFKENCLARGQDARVDVITSGPSGFEDCLYRALGTGADKAIHLITEIPEPAEAMASSNSDPVMPGHLVPAPVTAQLLAGAVSDMDYDLILTGVMSQDLMAGQTGPVLAEILNLPCATAVVQMDLNDETEPGESSLLAKREMEGGLVETLEIPLPALVSIQSGFYTPRYPVLSHMLKARQKPVINITIKNMSRSQEVFYPPLPPESSRQGIMVQGSLKEQVDAFTSFVSERGLI